MDTHGHPPACRLLFLIGTPKLAEAASEMFLTASVPMHYALIGEGTASSEIMDILGLGSSEKGILLAFLPKPLADKMLDILYKKLRLGTVNSGIAFTMPLSGANSLTMKMMLEAGGELCAPPDRKEDHSMLTDTEHTLIAVVVNQGHSEDVMNAARSAGARGGTVLHSRGITGEKAMSFWGFSIPEEREIVLIVTDHAHKVAIMQDVSKSCGLHSEAQGIVLSFPIDTAIGLDNDD